MEKEMVKNRSGTELYEEKIQSKSKTTLPQTTTTIPAINTILNQLYPTSEVSRVPRHDSTAHNVMSNLYIVKRENFSKILIESKTVTTNIEVDDVSSFGEEVEHYNCNGIFLSQNSGISSKPNSKKSNPRKCFTRSSKFWI